MTILKVRKNCYTTNEANSLRSENLRAALGLAVVAEHDAGVNNNTSLGHELLELLLGGSPWQVANVNPGVSSCIIDSQSGCKPSTRKKGKELTIGQEEAKAVAINSALNGQDGGCELKHGQGIARYHHSHSAMFPILILYPHSTKQ